MRSPVSCCSSGGQARTTCSAFDCGTGRSVPAVAISFAVRSRRDDALEQVDEADRFREQRVRQRLHRLGATSGERVVEIDPRQIARLSRERAHRPPGARSRLRAILPQIVRDPKRPDGPGSRGMPKPIRAATLGVRAGVCAPIPRSLARSRVCRRVQLRTGGDRLPVGLVRLEVLARDEPTV